MITPRRRKRDSFLPWIQLTLDLVLIYSILRFAFWFRFKSSYFDRGIPLASHEYYLDAFNFVTLLVVFLMRSYGLYRGGKVLAFSNEASRVFRAVIVATLIVAASTFFIRSFSYSRTFIVIAGLALAVGVSLGRYLLGLLVMGVDKVRGSRRNVLIIGCDDNAKRLVKFYRKNPRLSTRVIGFLDDKRPVGEIVDRVPVLGSFENVGQFIREHRQIHEIVLARPGVSNEEVLRLVYECEKEMIAFRWIADIFGLIASKMNVSYDGGVQVLSFTDSPLADWENQFLKRSFDIFFSLLALIILSPIFLIVTLLIKKDSKGPVFYAQERIGEDGQHFMLYKFRTMKVGAETQTGPVWAVKDDPRRTKLGSFLRENNLDELPQFWNTLRGDMSLVGPRPERPFFVSQFKEDIPRYMARHSIKSGITGWAQVNGLRGNTSITERTKFDLYYIENWSLWLDFKIILLTVFSRKNAY